MLNVVLGTADDALWLPNTQRPPWLDGALPGDRGFDPLGLAKPAEYLQYDVDQLDQNKAVNKAGKVGSYCDKWSIKQAPSHLLKTLSCGNVRIITRIPDLSAHRSESHLHLDNIDAVIQGFEPNRWTEKPL